MNQYWFRKRRGLISGDLGWGWRPISWEGWALIAGTAVGLFHLSQTIKGMLLWIGLISGFIAFIYVADLKSEDKVLFKG